MIELKNNKGITLVVLVITIVVMIILASVAITALQGEDGIMENSESLKDTQKVMMYKDELEMAKSIVKLGKHVVLIDDYLTEVQNINSSKMPITLVEKIDSKTAHVIVEDKYEFYIQTDEENDLKISYSGKEDELAPRILTFYSTHTIASITVKSTAVRQDNYTYYLSTTADGVYDESNKITSNVSGIYTFEDLIQDQTYFVRVVAKNDNGEDEKTIIVVTNEMPSIEPSELNTDTTPHGWYNGDKVTTATINTTKDLTSEVRLQWADTTGLTTEQLQNATWNFYPVAGITSSQNSTISFRLSAGSNYTSYISRQVGKIDKLNPVIKAGPSITSSTTNSMDLSIKVQDVNSGIGKIEWHCGNKVYVDEIQTLNGEDAGPITEITRTHKFTGLTQTTEYNVYAVVYDVAGNSVTSNSATEGNITDTVTTLTIAVNPQSETTTWSRSKQIVINAAKQNFTYIVYTLDGSNPEINANGTAKVGTLYNGEFTITGNCSIKAKAYDSDKQAGAAAILTISTIDRINPIVSSTTTANTNTVKIKATDEASGIVGYAVTETNVQPTTFTSCTSTKNLSVDVGGKSQNTDYYVWVKDAATNVSSSFKVHTETIPDGTITISNCEWSGAQDSDKARIKATTTTDFTVQYSSNPTNSSSWQNVSSTGYTGYNYNAGTTIYTRLTDGNNVSDYLKCANYTIPKREHQVTAPTPKTGLIYTGNAQVLINAGSSATGTIKYRFGTTGDWETNAANIKKTDAGTYVVSYIVPASTNYNAYSGDITVTIGKATPTVTAPTAKTLTYNTTDQALVNAGSTTGGTLQYKLGSGDYGTSIPTGKNAGSYSVYYRVVGNNNYNDVAQAGPVAVTIAKADPTYTAPTAKTLIYTGSAQSLVNAGTVTAGGTMQYKLSTATDYSTTIPAGTAAGSYTVNWKITGTSNYNEASGSVNITISKAASTGTVPTAISGLVYNRGAQSLINAGSNATGTWKYKLSTASTWETTASNVKATDAGTYTVNYYVAGDSNHNDGVSGNLTVTIGKATPTYTAPTAKTLTYTGNAQSLVNAGAVTYGGTMQYKLSTQADYTTTIPTGTAAGSYTVNWKITGTSNYNEASGSVNVTIGKATPTYTAPTAKTGLVWTGSAQQLINAGSVNSGNGTMQYKLSTSSTWTSTASDIKGTAYQTYTVSWKITEGTNHTSVAGGDITVTISHTHSYSSKISTTATCTSSGTATYRCACGATTTSSESALGHSYGSWTVTSWEGCGWNGSESRTCSRCGDVQTQTRWATGNHSYSWVQDGSTKQYKCSGCGAVSQTQYYISVTNGSGSGWYNEGDTATIISDSGYDTTSGWQGQTAEVEGNVRYKTHSWKTFTEWSGNIGGNGPRVDIIVGTPITCTANFSIGTETVDREKYTKHTSTTINHNPFTVQGAVWNASIEHGMSITATYGTEDWKTEKLGNNDYTLYYDGANTIRFYRTSSTAGTVKFYKRVCAGYNAFSYDDLGSNTTDLNKTHDVSATISTPTITTTSYSWDAY